MLAIAPALNALAVGLSWRRIRWTHSIASVVIGLVAAAMTALGLALGNG